MLIPDETISSQGPSKGKTLDIDLQKDVIQMFLAVITSLRTIVVVVFLFVCAPRLPPVKSGHTKIPYNQHTPRLLLLLPSE